MARRLVSISSVVARRVEQPTDDVDKAMKMPIMTCAYPVHSCRKSVPALCSKGLCSAHSTGLQLALSVQDGLRVGEKLLPAAHH